MDTQLELLLNDVNTTPHCIVRLLYWCERFNDYSENQMLRFFKTCTPHGQLILNKVK